VVSPTPSGQATSLCAAGKESEAIALLLEEYRALRAESVQRVANRMQMVTILGILAAISTVSSDNFSFTSPGIYAAACVVGVAAFWIRHNNRAVQRIGRHLRLVEERIHQLANRAYGSQQPLLSWELTRQAQREQLRGVKRQAGLLSGWTLNS
jgi:hypothetical protein